VAILDADKEGFLRSDRALIQTIGRAARNVNGRVIMYADKMTDSMKRAIDETNRRREKQVAYNIEHGIEPVSIVKAIYDLTARVSQEHAMAEYGAEYDTGSGSGPVESMPRKELQRIIDELEDQMKQSARDLEFERAAVIRDQIYEMRTILAEQSKLPPWQRAKLLAGEISFNE
jgi:excinuclease ABC subunit B